MTTLLICLTILASIAIICFTVYKTSGVEALEHIKSIETSIDYIEQYLDNLKFRMLSLEGEIKKLQEQYGKEN